jgi:membrane-bound metal-dependent hydrolase YbcI (DUF457 family)
VLLWFLGGTTAVVWNVFRDPAIDHRLLLLGAVLPDAVDGPFGGARIMHSVLASVVLLVVVMLATRGRRATRRRLLALPIGTFVHLVLDAAWARKEMFWWPLFGRAWDNRPLPAFDHGTAAVVVEELVGAVALVWAYRRFRLGEPERRTRLLRTGRLGRDLVGPPGPAC